MPFFDEPADPELSEAVRYMRNHPPKKQIIQQGNLAWTAAAPQNLRRPPCAHLCAAGEEQSVPRREVQWPVVEPHRSEQLLGHSLTILRSCLAASEDITNAFHG